MIFTTTEHKADGVTLPLSFTQYGNNEVFFKRVKADSVLQLRCLLHTVRESTSQP